MAIIKVTLELEVEDALRDNLFERFLNEGRNIAVSGAPSDDEDSTVNANAPALDANNVPWIAEVHSANKGLNQDGSWRRRRGVDKAHAEMVENAARHNPSAAPVYTAPIPTTVTPTAARVVPLPVAAPVGLPGMPALVNPVPAVVVPPVSYDELIAKVTDLSSRGVTGEQFQAAYAAAGVTDVNALQTDETVRRRCYDEMAKLG